MRRPSLIGPYETTAPWEPFAIADITTGDGTVFRVGPGDTLVGSIIAGRFYVRDVQQATMH